MKKTRKAFTLIELLVVVSIIALLVAILMPALGRAKEMAKRAQCGANLHALGIAVVIYQTSNRGSNPLVGLRSHADAYFGFGWYNTDRTDTSNPRWLLSDWNWFSTDPIIPTIPGGCLWLLVLHADVNPDVFMCPSDDNAEEINMELALTTNTDIEGFTDLNDFQTMLNLGYGYNDPFNQLLDDSASSALVIMADANPKFDSVIGTGTPDPDAPYVTAARPEPGGVDGEICTEDWTGDWTDRTDTTAHVPGNSKNHKHEMQVVLFADGRVKQHQNPRAGIAQDNIYTYWAGPVCPAKALGFWDTDSQQFRGQGAINKKDTYVGY